MEFDDDLVYNRVDFYALTELIEWYRLRIRRHDERLRSPDLRMETREHYEKDRCECIGKWAGTLFRARELIYEKLQDALVGY